MTYNPKVVHLPGTKLTPEVVLHRTLQKLDSIAGVVVLIQWKDSTVDVDWSNMKLSELAFASVILQKTVVDQVFEK